MSIQVISIVNKPISSVTYIIYKEQGGDCVIIDPGSEYPDEIEKELIAKNLKPIYIILTHEHFDHIWSSNFFIKKYNPTILCSEYCAKAIQNSKLNLSIFYDSNCAFQICPNKLIIVNDSDSFPCLDSILVIKEAQGHSLGGILIKFDKFIFTGDTLIKDLKTVTKLKNASKIKLYESIEYLNRLKGDNYIILPGHGEPFELDNYNLLLACN